LEEDAQKIFNEELQKYKNPRFHFEMEKSSYSDDYSDDESDHPYSNHSSDNFSDDPIKVN
jgi:hypothetical protein